MRVCVCVCVCVLARFCVSFGISKNKNCSMSVIEDM